MSIPDVWYEVSRVSGQNWFRQAGKISRMGLYFPVQSVMSRGDPDTPWRLQVRTPYG